MERKDSVLISCYVDQLIDNTDGKFDGLYEAWFIVSMDWAECQIKKQGWTTIEKFFDEYTFDHTDGWLHKAVADGVLLGCGTGQLPKEQ